MLALVCAFSIKHINRLIIIIIVLIIIIIIIIIGYNTRRSVLSVRYAWFLWAGPAYMGIEVSQAHCRPHPPNPSSPVNVYKLLNMFQAIIIGVLSEVASPHLVQYGL